MKLNEIVFPPQIADAAAVLKKSGFRVLGNYESNYGKVFYKPGDKSVLKLYSDGRDRESAKTPARTVPAKSER